MSGVCLLPLNTLFNYSTHFICSYSLFPSDALTLSFSFFSIFGLDKPQFSKKHIKHIAKMNININFRQATIFGAWEGDRESNAFIWMVH